VSSLSSAGDQLSGVIDATEWPEISGLLPPGTRDKVWVYDPASGRRALFKKPKAGTCEHVCEKVTAAIAKVVGLAAPEVRYARRADALGTIIYSFLGDGERLIHGGEIFAGLFEGFDPWDYKSHTYQRLRKIIIVPAISVRIHEMILFDAMAGNVDRHVNNWGIVSNSFQYFAPFFDNGSTLFARCGDEMCEHLLRDKVHFAGLIRNCDSRIYWEGTGGTEKLRHFDFVMRVKAAHPKEVQAVEQRFKDATVPQLLECLEDVPEGWLTPRQREVGEMLIKARYERLLEVLG